MWPFKKKQDSFKLDANREVLIDRHKFIIQGWSVSSIHPGPGTRTSVEFVTKEYFSKRFGV